MSLRLFVLGKQMSGHLWRLEFSLFSSFPGEQILFWASVNRIYLWAVYLFPAVIHFPSPCYLSKNGASLTGLDLMGVLCSRSVVVWLYNCCKWLLCCENKKHSGEDFFFFPPPPPCLLTLQLVPVGLATQFQTSLQQESAISPATCHQRGNTYYWLLCCVCVLWACWFKI